LSRSDNRPYIGINLETQKKTDKHTKQNLNDNGTDDTASQSNDVAYTQETEKQNKNTQSAELIKPIFCHKCGKKIPYTDAQFCPFCGAKK
jgi:rubrerythrin